MFKKIHRKRSNISQKTVSKSLMKNPFKPYKNVDHSFTAKSISTYLQRKSMMSKISLEDKASTKKSERLQFSPSKIQMRKPKLHSVVKADDSKIHSAKVASTSKGQKSHIQATTHRVLSSKRGRELIIDAVTSPRGLTEFGMMKKSFQSAYNQPQNPYV